jgi:ABC-type amino acid transport substrate-binding protein
MKKIISLVLVAIMVVFCFASCAKKNSDFVATDATDLLKEDFGIAVQKGNAALLEAVNKVVDEWVADGTMTKYVDYYTALSDFEAGADGATKPEAGDLKLTWDFGAATETITVYTESGFAPFEFISNGQVIGVDIAIMSQVAANMGKKLDIQDVAFDTIPTCVEQAKGDAVGAAGMTITDERKQTVDFSNIYYSSTIVVVSAKDEAISSVRDLTGKTVAVQEGTSGDIIISKAITADGYKYVTENDAGEEVEVVVKCGEGTTVKQYKQYALALEDLKAGRVDAILMDKLPVLTMLAVAD